MLTCRNYFAVVEDKMSILLVIKTPITCNYDVYFSFALENWKMDIDSSESSFCDGVSSVRHMLVIILRKPRTARDNIENRSWFPPQGSCQSVMYLIHGNDWMNTLELQKLDRQRIISIWCANSGTELVTWYFEDTITYWSMLITNWYPI